MNRMRIACPSCGADYEVPDRLLAGGARTLRCSRCGTGFGLPRAAPAAVPSMVVPLAEPPAPPSDPPAPAPREGTPVDRAAPGEAALLRAWVVSLALVAGGAMALVVFRSEVMTAWPPATRLFAVLGLA